MSTLTVIKHPVSNSHLRPHRHEWDVESRHHSSEGIVYYLRCLDCGSRRIDLRERSTLLPSPHSKEIAPASPGN